MTTKICGYNCDYNKGGICQRTNCIHKTYLTNTTDGCVISTGDGLKIYRGNVSIKTDETLDIEKLKQELDKYKHIVEEIKAMEICWGVNENDIFERIKELESEE